MSKPTKTGTVALVIRFDQNTPVLLDSLSDDSEIATFEAATVSGQGNPLECVYTLRQKQAKEDEDFGNYVEELLSQPFVRPEIQEHAIHWLKSKIKIEQFQKSEREATQVIAAYAYRVFAENPWRKDFYLAGPNAKVRILVLMMPPGVTMQGSDGSQVA